MSSPSNQILFSLLVLALLVAVVSASFEGHPIDFNYWGKTSPNSWGNKYKTCGEGKTQSPVNINQNETVISKTLEPLTSSYKAANASLVDNGVNIGIRYQSEHAYMSIDGKNYTMKLMHWHSPSEHTIDGVQYPLELHIVHQAEDRSLAVVGILYEYGRPNKFISSIDTSLKKLAEMVKEHDKASEVPLGMLNIKLPGKKTRRYWRYVGSLTTPPCSEPVLWTVLPKLKRVTKKQVEDLKSPLTRGFKDNCRPVQPLKGRKVVMYNGANDE